MTRNEIYMSVSFSENSTVFFELFKANLLRTHIYLYINTIFVFLQVFHAKKLIIKFVKTQRPIPTSVGTSRDTSVHLRLPVSFFIVISVVEHGQ